MVSVPARLQALVDQLGIVENDSRIVADTKALHHVLPELVVPIDRAYTGRFFGWHNPEFTSTSRLLRQALPRFGRVAVNARVRQFVQTERSWNMSVSKVIDNAIIGLLRLRDKLPTETQRATWAPTTSSRP